MSVSWAFASQTVSRTRSGEVTPRREESRDSSSRACRGRRASGSARKRAATAARSGSVVRLSGSTKTSGAVCTQDAVSEWPAAGRRRVPWRLSRSVIDSVGPPPAGFAPAEYAPAAAAYLRCWQGAEMPGSGTVCCAWPAGLARGEARVVAVVTVSGPGSGCLFRRDDQ